MPRPLHLSATAIRSFLHCPNCFRYAYIEGFRPIVEPEQFRVGTNWHKMHEVYRSAPEGVDPFEAAMDALHQAYAIVPDTFDDEEWEIERTTLAMCFAGYIWYYQNDTIETLATEVPFMLPLRHPRTNLPLPKSEILVPGKIDRIVRWQGKIGIADYKSTTHSIQKADAEFWSHLRLDSQISLYCLSALDLYRMGELAKFGITGEDDLSGAFYDVWHKPGISPKALSQADSAEMIASQKYLETPVQVEVGHDANGVVNSVVIEGKPAKFEPGKKAGTVAIVETPTMYGARLLKDIYERPDFYFQRREIPRTRVDLSKFRKELYSIYQTIRYMRENGFWYRNDTQDSIAAHGEYGPLCYHDFDPAKDEMPTGFRNIFEEAH